MPSINKILVVLDVYNDFRDNPAHQPAEIKKALRLAKGNPNLEIYLIGCGFEEFLHDNYSNFGTHAIEQRKKFIHEMEERLAEFAVVLMESGVKVDCHVHWTYPRYEQIAKEAESLDVDLVIQHVNMQHMGELHNLSHDTWQLVKTCKKPMLLIKDREWGEQPIVMAAVDPVHRHHKPLRLDNSILDIAVNTAEMLMGRTHVVHAYSESARPFSQTGSIRESHTTAMDDLLSDYTIDAEAIHLMDKTPAQAILDCADLIQADITVIGALSRSRLADAIIGNTADRVLDYIKSDLYIVKPVK